MKSRFEIAVSCVIVDSVKSRFETVVTIQLPENRVTKRQVAEQLRFSHKKEDSMKKFVVLLMCIILVSASVSAADIHSDPDNHIFGFFQDAANFVTEKAAQAGEAITGAFSAAGETIGKWFAPNQQGSDAGSVFDNIGQGISNFASQAAETIASASQSFAEQASTAFSNVSEFVVNGFNNLFPNPTAGNNGSENPKAAISNEMQSISSPGN